MATLGQLATPALQGIWNMAGQTATVGPNGQWLGENGQPMVTNPNIQSLINSGALTLQGNPATDAPQTDADGNPLPQGGTVTLMTPGTMANMVKPPTDQNGNVQQPANFAPTMGAGNTASWANDTIPGVVGAGYVPVMDKSDLIDPSKVYNDPNYGPVTVMSNSKSNVNYVPPTTLEKIGQAATMAALAAGFGSVGAGIGGSLFGGAADATGGMAGAGLDGAAGDAGSGSLFNMGNLGSAVGKGVANFGLNELTSGGNAQFNPMQLTSLLSSIPGLSQVLPYLNLAGSAYGASKGNVGAGIGTIGQLAKMGGFQIPGG